jgi:pyruvate/oxaloacetate carboxyltransferase
MPALREELSKKGIAPTDDNAVLFAMFPRETEAFYQKKSAPAAPAPRPIEVAPPANGAPAQPKPALNGHSVRRFFITINSRRSEVLVEEVA